MLYYGPFIVFNAQSVDVAELVDSIKTKVALWTKNCFNIQDYSVEDIDQEVFARY